MIRFEEAVPLTVNEVEASACAVHLKSATIIRDLKGTIRLLVEFHPSAEETEQTPEQWSRLKTELKTRLEGKLGSYWGRAIWRRGRRDDIAFRAFEAEIDQARERFEGPSTTGIAWYKLERTYSKSSWLTQGTQPPWPLDDQNPGIVSFYSFKGGVGRTTLLAAMAILLARTGKAVSVLDLDLEAPGIGGLLLGGEATEDGIVDYLIERQVSGDPPANLDRFASVENNPELIANGKPIRVFSAGNMDAHYVEKISRLDFEGYHQPDNPLTDLLVHIKGEFKPDFILIDSRSGLHDLGGLSLNNLSHLDVVVASDTPQNWAGLKMVLPMLRKAEKNVLVAHSMFLRKDHSANERFREKCYGLFRDYFFYEDQDVPDTNEPFAPYGFPILHQEALVSLGELTQEALSLLTAPNGQYTMLLDAIGVYLGRNVT